MSAVNVFLYADAAAVMTDGRTTTGDGKLRAPLQKIFPLAHLNAVVCVRGIQLFGHTLSEVINLRRASFDDAREHLGEDLEQVHRTLNGLTALPNICVEAYLVGLSAASGDFECWIAPTREIPGAAAFSAVQTGDMYSPDPAHCDAETTRLANLARTDPGEFDLEVDGPALMRGQSRAFPEAVGDFCQLTVVDRAGIRIRILDRW